MAVTDQIINVESGGNPNATNPNSSASGPGQFIDSTWLSTVKAHRPDIAAGKSDDEILGLKTDPALSREMTAAYAGDNQAILAKNGLPVTPGTTYLAHFAGPNGAVKVLQADPNVSVESVLGPAVVKANPFLQGMTAQGLQAWAAKKMGTPSPQPGSQPTAAAPTANNQQIGQLPTSPAPIFANAPSMPQIKPFQDASVAPAPIFAPQQRPLDLSGLRAALAARAPIFANRG